MIIIPMEVSTTDPVIEMEVTAEEPEVSFNVDVVFESVSNPYSGQYVVTPSQEEQVLQTNGLVMLDNVTINPIPSNYGLITWNGSVITVS